MPRKKQRVRTSWAEQFANESSNLKNLDDLNAYDKALLNEIQSSIERTALLEDDINRMREQRKLMQEDPEGYPYKQNEYSSAVEEAVRRSGIQEMPEELHLSFNSAANKSASDEAITDYNARNAFANYRKNWYNSHGRLMNDFQIQDFLGYLDRSDQWERLANDVEEYWNIEDRVNQINKEISNLRMKTSPNSEDMLNISQQITDLLYEQKQLVQRHDELESSVEAFKSYVPGGIRAQYYNLMAGDGSLNIMSNNGIFGRTSQFHDEMGDILRFTSSIFSPKRTREEQRKMLNAALQEKAKKYKEWQKGLELNIIDRESYGKVDDWFKQKEEQAGTNIFDADTWLYKMPGLIAGSTSGMSKILPAMITGAVTGAAAAATGGAAGLLIGALGGAATYLMNYGAGVAENNAEVAMAYNERLENYLRNAEGKSGTIYDDIVLEGRKKLPAFKNLTDKQIFELYRKGGYTVNNATANKKMQDLAVGIESQFQDDMAATTWSAGLETALQVLPVGRVISVAKPVRYQMLKTAARREAVRNGTFSTLAQGYEIGQAASPILGALYAPIHLAISPAIKRAGKIGSAVLDGISKTAHIADDIPSEVLKKNFMSSTRKKYFKDIAGRWGISSIAEGVEEGKQNISSDRYKSGYYTDAKIKSIGETILDDFLAGSKSAGLLLGMPFEGAMSEKDREILQEIKGGFILGGLLTAIVNTSQSIAPYRSEQKATTAIVNSVLLDKAAKIDQLNKARIYAEAAKSSSAFQNMLNGFDRLRQANKDQYDASGEYGINPDAIDDEEKQFRKIASMSTDGFTIKQAKAQGIEPGSQEYNNFVATKALVTSELEDAQEVSKLAGENLQQAVTAAMEPFLTAQLKREAAAIPGAQIEDEEEGSPVAQFTSAENFNQLNNVAQYSALLKMKDQLELGVINAQKGGHKKTEKILMKQLTTVNDRINNLKPVINKYTNEDETIDVNNLESVETKLALDKEMHDKLTEAYRQQFVADQDLDLAWSNYERVVGEAYINGEKVDNTKKVDWGKEFDNVTFKNGHASEVMRDIQETIDDDNDLASVIDEDFEDRTDDNGEEVITPEQAKVVEETAPENNPDEEFKKDVESNVQEAKPAPETPVEPILKTAEPVSAEQHVTVPEPVETPSEELKKAPRVPRKATQKQSATMVKLNTIAEQSKKTVKAVTPEHYVIEIDGKERQIPRVHTIMPKYWASDGSFNPALQMGNAFDNLARMFFGDKNNLTEYETNKDALIDRLFNSFASDGKDERLSKMTYAQLMPVRKAFEETIDDLYALADQYDRNGWELSTEPIVWHADFASGPVAGETDMIAVDQEGNVHIIDFKTASAGVNTDINPFGRFEITYTYSIPEELEKRRLALNQEDFTAGPRKKGLSKNARSFIRDVRKAKNNNHIKVNWNPTTQQAELKYIDSNYAKAGNSSYRVTHTYDGKVKGSKQDEYSDQLTAYKEMIQRQLGNVVGMEVVGFRVQYSHDGTNVTAVGGIRNTVNGQPFRVMVEMSDEMGNILNVEAEAPKFENPKPDPVVEATNTNEANDQVREKELKKADKTKFEQPEPEPVTPEEIAAAEKATVNGRSNLNDKVLDREHPALVNGIVFDKNFIADAIANGTVEVYTEVVKDRNGEIPSVYVDVTYNGKTYKRIFVYADPTLLAKVQALEKVKQPGLKIVATNISRTKGALVSGEVKSVTESGLVDQPVEELEFTPQNMSFGFVKNGNIVAFPNGNTKQQDIIGKTQAPNGTMVYMKRVPRTESEGGDKFIPVAVSRRTLAGDADFIVDCLKKVDALGMPYTIVVNGQEVSIGATRKELLDILIPYVGDPNQARKTWAIVRNPNIPSIFAIVNPDGQSVAQVDIRSEKSIDDFNQALQGVQIVEQNDILASRIGSHSATPAFAKIKKFFANTKSGAKAVNISDNLKFDFEDFKGEGLSGLGWYVKHGVFASDYAGIGSPKMSINDVGLMEEKPKPAEPTKVTPVEEVAPKQGFDPMDMPIIGNWGGLNKRKTVADADKPLLTKEEIKRRLRPILGDLVDDPTIVHVYDVYANDPRVKDAKVVGRATADAIILYNEAFENVDFHEAFHRIFELFVPKNVRESVYAKAAKQLGIDLSKSTKETDYVGHRQVAEWLADKYMDETYYKEYTGVQWLDRVLNMIHDFVNAIAHIGNWQLYWTFLEINSGKYRNKRNASKENVDRFNEMFKELNYEIHGTQFDHIVNDPMYEEVKNSAFYCLLLGQDVDVSGATVQNTQISRAAFQRGADRLKAYDFDIFGTEVEPDQKNAAQLAMTEVMVKFESIADDLAAMMANISTDYRKVMLNEGREDADGGESQSSYDENFFKWSYEFNRFDKTTSRVKFFFATIPDMRWKEDGTGWEFATNSLGLPQLVPMNYVFNEVLSNLWDVDTVEEAIGRLSTLAIDDPMYSIILGNLRKIVAGKDKADNEALLAQLMSTIRSNRHTFMLLRAVQNPEGLYDLVVQRSDADYNARVFPIQWSQVLAKGGSETLKLDKYGNVIFNPNNEHAVHNFRAIAKLFDQLKDAVSTVNNGKGLVGMPSLYEYEDTMGNKSREVAWIEGRYTEDITNPNGCRIVKNLIVEALNTIGINIHTEELNYMLKHKYGSADWEALRQMMQSTDDTDSINSFLFFLDNIVKDGKLNISTDGMFTNQKGKQIPFDNIYSDMAFVKELGNWKYEFRHAHDQLSVLATGGNRFYEMSDNDYMSDVLRDLNKRGKFFRDLKGDPYNYYTEENNFGEEESHGSITIKQLSLDPSMKIALKHFIGFKTDKRGDEGQDYFEISRREDYLSKMGILENGGMISLTLSDKKKYVYISGIKLPGIDYTEINKSKDSVIDATNLASQQIFPPSQGINNTYDIQQREDVVEQMRSYALTEYKSILSQAEKLNDGHRKVANFDDGQGLRFSSLLGVWETVYDKEGNATGEQYISFNDGNKSWEENLGIAEAYFFSRPIAELQAMLQRILTKQAEKELKTAEELGLIETIGMNKNPFLNYRNKGLNNKVIKSLKLSYLERYKTFPAFTEAMAESMAIVAYMNDISNKAIMSGQEMERLFSGNPAFYKWKYNDAGMLVDRTVDELKRLGGLGSTGNNNFTQLDNIPRKYLDKNGKFTGKYVCAETDNEMVGSSQYELMKEKMYDGQLRSLIIDQEVAKETAVADEEYSTQKKNIRNNRDLSTSEKDVMLRDALQEYQKRLIEIQEFVCDKVDNNTVEELEKQYSHLVDKAREQADDVADALKEGIDVADGGAYISDTMCEMLLRMEGAYSKEIQEAFKILRGETKADYLGQIDAYQKVLTSVIGNQKYTAFGRRLQNGTSVPYYHKMALFPIFDCIATGQMRNVFDKMKEQGIDILLVNSAVKVGSEGSKPINWNDYRLTEDPSDENNFKGDIANQDWKPMFKDAFNFNTYECDFDYLRKQLNTDPKEEQMLRMGTQMQKIVYSNLVPGRTYKTRSGEPIKGHALLDRIMDASNKLSDMGVDKINKRFFVTNEEGEIIDAAGNVITDRNSNKRMLDIEKFSKEVSKQMSERGADKNVLQALELVTAENKTKQLSIPLGAISNASWLESVLISMLNKEIVDVNTPGAFFIQRSVWAMQGLKMYDGKKNVKGDLSNRQLYDGKPLKMVNEEGSMDCVLSLDFFQHILPQVPSGEYELDEDGNYVYERGEGGAYKVDEHMQPIPKKKMRDMTFDEARKWLMRKGIIGDKAKSSIVAYRIPTQAESSIHALRCVDVVPVVRDTVILPEEFTKITGSDFDIDKLGLSTFNYRNGSSKFEAGTEKFYQNQLIEDYLTLLTDPRTQHILHRSIDKDTKLLKDVLADIEHGTSQQEMPYGFYSLSTQTERKDDYITGKIGIGPFALNNNSHILTMLYGVKFREFDDSIMTELGLTDLSVHLDKDGNSIMSWLSALINAHVDIAKDPYISRLNVGPFTYNLVNTLIRTGLGAKTFYFTTQPIMKELSDAYNRAGSSYMADQYKSKYQLQKDAIEQVGKNRFGELKIDSWSFDELVQGISDPKDVKIKPVINNYIRQIFDEGILKTNANRTYNQIDGAELLPVRTTVDGEGEVEKVHFTPMQVQMLMYLAYLLFDPYATSVSNLVKYSKIDTKKHGKSYVEQQIYLKGFKKLFDNKDGGGLFEPEGLLRLAKQSYIELKTINAISMTKNILKGQFLQATNAFDNAIQHVLNMIGKPDSLSVDLWNEVSRAITASIKSEFINEYAGALRPGNDTYIHDLVSESEETFEYTQSAKSNVIKLAGKPKYSLKSYMHKKAHVELMYKDPKTGERKPYSDDYTIIGYNDETNELIVDKQRKLHNNGKITIKGGENTIYDRFNRLAVELREDPAYRDILDAAGEPRNMLLRSLVTGKTFDYKPISFAPTYLKPEGADTYETLKFIKLFNALDQNGVESNFIIDAWDELLHDDNHPKLKEFAEDLVVYAFVTSGDQGGFTKFFKQVPFSWRKESGYADFINRKLVEFQSQDITTEQLQDAILNNWHNNLLVPKYNLLDEHKQPNFMAYSGESLSTNYLAQRGYPTILAALKDNNGILEVSIDPDNAPLFIKIPRRTDKDARDSQRRVTVYKRVSYGMRKSVNGKWVHYPIYVKVEPKGNLLKGNFLMTEYGREDSLHKEYGPSEDGMKKMFALGDFIEHNVVEEYKLKWGQIFGQMIEDMNYQYLYKKRFAGNEEAFVKALNKQEKNSEYKGVTKIISGGQTGVDTIGLEVGKELGLQTGGTITPGFYREQNVDQYTRQQLEEFGLQEISKELQAGKSGKEFYLPRTEQNVINSDGTVYFASDEDSAGKIATERFAKSHNKPFILNPTAEELRDWLAANNISVLNVAGNRGSKIGNMRDSVVNVLKQALNKNEVVEENPTLLTKEELEEAEKYKKMCEGE